MPKDVIRLLPDAISNQIAAGEVVQRPASVVKECLENSVDAGAQKIQLFIQDAGKGLIQIVDDGCGMSETDARMSFEKHATSKINSIEDLFDLHTMGFRGEALASIGAVAQVVLKTKQADTELGTSIQIDGGKVAKQEPIACSTGTSIAIKNLFFNIPARRNFLKSNAVEQNHIITEFQRVALANEQVQFELHIDGRLQTSLKPGNLKQRIVGVFGDRYHERLVPVNEESEGIRVYGYVGKPAFSRKKRGDQFFIINNRFIRSPYLNKAVFQAFERLITHEHFPFFVIYIDIDPSKIDINIHPQKQEIKFADGFDKLVYTFVNAGVRHALGQYNVAPSIDFNTTAAMTNMEGFTSGFTNAETLSKKGVVIENKVENNAGPASSYRKTVAPPNWEKLYETNQKSTNELPIKPVATLSEEVSVFQFNNRYLVTSLNSGLLVIDQQIAHERVLFEEILSNFETKNRVSQRLLFPQTIELGIEDAGIIKNLLPDINALGFEAKPFGKKAFIIHSTPAQLQNVEMQTVFDEVIHRFKDLETDVGQLSGIEKLAKALAKSGAIKRGKVLTQPEQQMIVQRLFACKQPYVGVSKQPTFIRYEGSELHQQFESKP